MNQLSDRLNSLSPSATLAMSQKSSELKAQGVDVINLSVGEPDFNTPDHIKEAAKKAIDENYSRYSPVAGYPALRNAIVAKLKNENGLEYTAAQISCANGAKQSVCNTIMALINKGDEVIVPAPYWVSYPEMVKLAEGTPVIVRAGIIGFIAGPEWIVKGVNKLQGQYTSGPCSVSQKAAEAAYTGTQAPVEEMRKAFERRRDLIVKLAKEIPGFEVNFPQGAFYLFPKCDSFFGKKDGDRIINNADDLAMYLLEVGHVACVGGTSFGAPECIRMSYATSDENIVEAMRRIKETLARLK